MTTAKISYMQSLYEAIKKYHGFDKARLYLKPQLETVNLIINIIKTNNTKCDLKRVDSTFLHLIKIKYQK